MDFFAFRMCIKSIFRQLIDRLKQTKLYQELKIVINLEKSDLGSLVLPVGGVITQT